MSNAQNWFEKKGFRLRKGQGNMLVIEVEQAGFDAMVEAEKTVANVFYLVHGENDSGELTATWYLGQLDAPPFPLLPELELPEIELVIEDGVADAAQMLFDALSENKKPKVADLRDMLLKFALTMGAVAPEEAPPADDPPAEEEQQGEGDDKSEGGEGNE